MVKTDLNRLIELIWVFFNEIPENKSNAEIVHVTDIQLVIGRSNRKQFHVSNNLQPSCRGPSQSAIGFPEHV